MSPSYGMITEPLSDLSLGTRHLGHSRSLLKIKIYSLKLNLFNDLGFQGPPTPVGQGPCGFDKERSQAMK